MDAHDHRAIGKRLDLFHMQEEAPGMVFWHPPGFALYQVIEGFIRGHMRSAGFEEVRTPQLLVRELWEASGHWDKFGAQMFAFDDGAHSLALKPMSCPAHVQLFKQVGQGPDVILVTVGDDNAAHPILSLFKVLHIVGDHQIDPQLLSCFVELSLVHVADGDDVLSHRRFFDVTSAFASDPDRGNV